MKNKQGFKTVFMINLGLFWTFLKIGLFTFGGGYAMIPFIQEEVSVKHKWIGAAEISDILTISEATPGPIAINAATYIGYKINGLAGALFATFGICLPSFLIIFIISLFIDQFLAIEFIAHAFLGIKAAVGLLVCMGALSLYKIMEKNIFSYIILCSVLIAAVTLSLLNVSFSSIYYLIFGALFGLIFSFIVKERDFLKEDVSEAKK